MKNLIVNGKQEFMGMEIPVIEGGFGEGQKVVLAKTIASIHNIELKEVNRLINRNIDRFSKNDLIDCLSASESLRSFAKENDLIGSNRTQNVFILSQRGYTKLVAMMDNSNDKKWEVMNNLIDEYFTLRAKGKSGQANNFKTTEEFLIYQLQEQLKVKKELQEQGAKLNEVNQEVTRMKDCMLSDINKDNWRDECRKVLFKTACRMARVDDELDRDDYLSTLHESAWKLLKERMHCNVNARLKHIKGRMLANGATKTQVSKLNRLDVLEQDDKLKSAYIGIVQEIAMKH